MKFVTYQNNTANGELYLVSKDSTRVVSANSIVESLYAALQKWEDIYDELENLSQKLNTGLIQSEAIDLAKCIAPLPQTTQFCDASAFKHHGHLMAKAFNIPEFNDGTNYPLMYQGASDDFLGPFCDVPFLKIEDGIDFEGEYAVITKAVPMGITAEDAQEKIVLIVQLNDWSLRELGPREMKTGFGFIQAKPSSSFAPIAITPDELDGFWNNGRVNLDLVIEVNGLPFGKANGKEMDFSFSELIAHAALTRRLSAGTMIGSGTVSNKNENVGSSCIAEQRIREIIKSGQIKTSYLNFGDKIFMEAKSPDGQLAPFGYIYQQVIKATL